MCRIHNIKQINHCNTTGINNNSNLLSLVTVVFWLPVIAQHICLYQYIERKFYIYILLLGSIQKPNCKNSVFMCCGFTGIMCRNILWLRAVIS